MKVYLEFKEMEGREYNDAIIHNNVNLIIYFVFLAI